MKRPGVIEGVLFCSVFCSGLLLAQGAAPQAQRPNVVLVMADDHRRDLMSCMGHPFIKTPNMDRIAGQGFLFERAFCVTATCSPSRASIWTGKYPHQASHPAISEQGNSFMLTQTPFPKRLHDAGYTTGHIGKWHLTGDLEQQPGYDYWAGSHMIETDNPTITINGKEQKFEGFIDDVLSRLAGDFIQMNSPGDKPFFLSVGLKCPHLPYPYPERLARLFENDDIPKPDTYNENFNQSGRSPQLSNSSILIRKSAIWKNLYKTWDNYIKRHYRSVQSLDESLGMIEAALQTAGVADNTILIYTSDHGYSLGEHGFTEKHYAYGNPMSVPLIIRWPKGFKGGTRSQEMVLHIDVAPTVLACCGVPVPPDMRGRSLVPIFKANGVSVPGWRDEFLFTYDSRNGSIPGQYALRTDKYKLVRYQDNPFAELYDLEKDPDEKKSVARNPEYAGVLKDMDARLRNLAKQEGYTKRERRIPLEHCMARKGLPEEEVKTLSRTLHSNPLKLAEAGFQPLKSENGFFDVGALAANRSVLIAVSLERLSEWDPYVAMWVDPARAAKLWYNGEVLWHWTPETNKAVGQLLNPPMVNKTETALIELIGAEQKPVRLYLEAPEKTLKLL